MPRLVSKQALASPTLSSVNLAVRQGHQRIGVVGTPCQMVAVAQGSMLPHINMSIQRDLYSQEDLFGDDARSWSLGVYATWDIFKGMQNIGEVKKAKAQKRAAAWTASARS